MRKTLMAVHDVPLLTVIFLVSIVVSIPACHAGDRGSIPRQGGSQHVALFVRSGLRRLRVGVSFERTKRRGRSAIALWFDDAAIAPRFNIPKSNKATIVFGFLLQQGERGHICTHKHGEWFSGKIQRCHR